MVPKKLPGNAKRLRTSQTDAELRLWYHLRAHRFHGLKFRRQTPMGPYIVDFLCVGHGLVIEVDGGQHSEAQVYDTRRDAWLAAQGCRVLRFSNEDVLKNTDDVLECIRQHVSETLSPGPSPALRERGGRREE